jgi:hypothetical protein
VTPEQILSGRVAPPPSARPLVALFFFLRIAFDCFKKMGQARPGSGIGLLDSPTGSSLPKS